MSRRRSAIAGLAVLVLAGIAVVVIVLVGSRDGAAAPAWGASSRAPVPAPAMAGGAAIASVDPAGTTHVVWSRTRDGRSSLYESRRPAGGAWTAPRAVVAGRRFAIAPEAVAANARGDAVVAWSERGDRRAVVRAATLPAGGGWSRPQTVSLVRSTIAWLPGVQVGIDDAGTATLIGRGLAGGGLWATRAREGAWSALRRVTPPGAGSDSAWLDVAPGGVATVAGQLKRHGLPRVLWSRSATPDGRWGQGAILPGSELSTLPAFTRSDDGTVLVAWERRRGGGRTALLSASRTAAGRWSAPRTLRTAPAALLGVPRAGSGGLVAWARWDGPPARRVATVRALGPSGVEDVATVRLPPPPRRMPGQTFVPVPPPLSPVIAGGPTAVALWTAGERVVATSGSGGAWGTPRSLSAPGAFAYPLAAGSSPAGATVVWAESPPGGPATRILAADAPR